jgi:hypothetical protein
MSKNLSEGRRKGLKTYTEDTVLNAGATLCVTSGTE